MKTLLQKFRHLFDPIDLTSGKILPSFLAFLIPIVLSMIFQQIYSITDAIIVGQNLSENEIAGINDAIPIANMVLNFSIGCTSGFSVILGNAIGEKNEKKAKESILIQVILSLVISVLMMILSYFLIDPLLALIKITPSSSNPNMQAIYQASKDYLVVLLVFGTMASMLYNLIVSILRVMGDSFTPFLFLVLSTILNIILDLIFVIPLQLGVKGSAIATILSQGIAMILAFLYAFQRYPIFRIHKGEVKITGKDFFHHLTLGIPLGFQWSILFIGVITMSGAVIPFDIISETEMVIGNPAQVGYGVANKLTGLLMGCYSALGTGLLAFFAQNLGAKQYKRIRKGFQLSCYLTSIIALFCFTIGMLLSINGTYQRIFLSSDKITEASIKYGNAYLYVALPFFIPLGFIYVGRNAVQAFEKPFFPLLSGIVELLTRVLVCLYLPPFINKGPIDASASFGSYLSVCFADPITWVASMIVVIIPTIYYIYKKFPRENVLDFKPNEPQA